ncbi:MAG: BtrH N-terminal domain-containing protein [Bacteroidales bacterium]|nr:BtrH N-terminal domain-containing protein [Bacteroidales bacterium]
METNKIVLNYTHRQAGHCESGATSNLLNFYGHDLSEPMAFGIGNGLYFSYIPFLKVQYAPMISFRNLPNVVFHRSAKYLNIDATVVKKIRDPKESMLALDRNLERGIPTGMQVGTFNITFFPPEYRMHYNMHNFVCFGKEGNLYHISDTVMEDTQVLSYEDLLRVRYAKGPFAPNGKMYWINNVPKELDMKSAIAAGIKKTVYEMIKIPFPLIGVKGLRWLSRDLKKWPRKHGNDKASFYLGQILRMAEDFGTGGAGFRYIYGAFLKESGELLNNSELLEASDMMGKTANQWREFTYIGAKNCKNRAAPQEDYGMLGNRLFEIAEMEEKVYRKLDKIKI